MCMALARVHSALQYVSRVHSATNSKIVSTNSKISLI